MDYRKRLARFHQLLHPANTDHINEHRRPARQELTELSLGTATEANMKSSRFIGIPDEYRPATYRVLLNLSPASVSVDHYLAFVEEISKRVAAEVPPSVDEKPSKTDKLLREIQRDVERTLTPLAWFGAPLSTGDEDQDEDPLWKRIALLDGVDTEKSTNLSATTRSTEGVAADSGTQSDRASSTRLKTRRAALLRPLFIYATLNPGLSYVQGMNSLLAVFYWIFSSDPEATPIEAEAAAFFALGAILSQLRDLYVPSLDGTPVTSSSSSISLRGSAPTGLGATLARFTSLLTWLDPTVAMALEHKNVDPTLYVFRWLTTWFANEFQLPDLVRIWDRVIALYPAEDEIQPVEALSPVLGHLIDLSLAMVLFERPTVVSPYAHFQKVVMVLQDPQIGGEDVEKLLATAWEIRQRRIGKASNRIAISPVSEPSSPTSSPTTTTNWRSAANKWASAASAAASTASASPAANSIRQRFFSAPSAPAMPSPRRPSLTNHASEYDLDDGASVADSETSLSSIPPPLFASKGQHVGAGTSHLRPTPAPGAIHEEILTVDGRVLPPPPDRIDQNPSLAQLIEDELPRSIRDPYGNDEEDDYGVDDSTEGPTLAERAANSWGTWRNRFAASDAAASLSKQATNLSIAAQVRAANLRQSTVNLGSSDSYAALSKTTTNLSAQAALLKEQITTSTTTDRLSKLKETVSGASGRFMASTGSERGPRRPGSPMETPFTPPRFSSDERGSFAAPPSPTSSEMGRGASAGGSGGPKPLLLSGAARRAAGGNNDSVTLPSPPAGSRRSSIIFGRSPSTSPVLNRSPRTGSLEIQSDGPMLGLARSNSRNTSALHGRTASYNPPLSTSIGPSSEVTHDDQPISSLRISGVARRPSFPEGQLSSTSTVSSKRAENGRGWTLTDAPVNLALAMSNQSSQDRLAPPLGSRHDDASSDVGSDESFHSVQTSSNVATPLESPELSMRGPSEDVRNMFAASDVAASAAPPRRSSLADTSASPPPRGSSLTSNRSNEPLQTAGLSSSITEEPFQPPSSTSQTRSPEPDLDTPLSPTNDLEPSASRSKIVRRPVISKRRASARMSGMSNPTSELSTEDRKVVSAFLAGETDAVGDLSRNRSRSSVASRKSRTKRESAASGWSEGDILDAYREDRD
ncbi:BZ3500_MvSof-1268-A1-R1_Chr8-2g10277 [Microbotryum saponariae]|uniref:BZ3500_MvSof-1268-A1-R1_Chr8-2g10277 protein n=1 Tax=Microbotryum saponariae TaxID=289078 RepID=A0A2X0LBJ0_9BASI|nr:BZ3500_MvSof-1268-A1-R1_Chr8-2g10277 [Microbotryum saponariae]SDA02078.1 BZ3501_MvSof-1269-A2-R1_Chr8-2g10027 [Microbotryum saponariae]